MRKNVMALAVVCVAVGVLWFGNRAVPLKDASWGDVVEEARSGGYELIKTDELWKKYTGDSETLLMVDTRQEWEFRAGHMKAAVNFPMEPTWLSRWQKKASLEEFLGPDKNQTIVFY